MSRLRASTSARRPISIVSSSRAAQENAAVVVSSSDLEELADLCQRVLVIVDGRISAVLEGAALTEGSITRSFMPLAAEPDALVKATSAS